MDRPLLHTLVDRLRADERLPAFAAALPTRARVSESALPLLVAALYEELGKPLCVLLPDDTDARDLAESAAWFLGEESVSATSASSSRTARTPTSGSAGVWRAPRCGRATSSSSTDS